MKRLICISFLCCFIISCSKLDLNPLSEASNENWNKNEKQISISLNDLYRDYLFYNEINVRLERLTDNWTHRQSPEAFVAGTITGRWSQSELTWTNQYKGIARANIILRDLEDNDLDVPEEKLNQFRGEARLMRAIFYAKLIFLYGDVPFSQKYLSIEDAFEMGRTDKNLILDSIYMDFDYAASVLPKSYGGDELQRATKGMALGFKARVALRMGDFKIARDAAQNCIDLDVYELYPNFADYFKSKTKNAKETIFAIPRSTELGEYWTTTNFITRNAGGSATAQPSWDLMCAFPCTDGLPIDESPLYDPQHPFKNRDPRLAATIVEFETPHLGFIYDPSPYATEVLNLNTGKMVKNNDSRSVTQYASYNGLILNKGVDDSWGGDRRTDFDIIIMRYAEVLLIYAEAKIELNEIDNTVLNAIDLVRARAYGVDANNKTEYPAVQDLGQKYLRKMVRNERRIEFAWENRRFYDLIRWHLAEKALTRPIYGMLDPQQLKEKVYDKGLWFFPGTPDIDDDGLPDFSKMYDAGLIKLLLPRSFDKKKQYLWPIPSNEILINDNLTQNPGY